MAMVRVRYKGLSDVRIIEQHDLASQNITVDKDLVWEAGNHWAIDMELSPEMELLLREDGGFRIEKLDDRQAPVGEPVVVESPPSTKVTKAQKKGNKVVE
jgi:hypothetical protein